MYCERQQLRGGLPLTSHKRHPTLKSFASAAQGCELQKGASVST